MQLNLTIKLPQLYPLQEEIVRSPAKRKVIVAGRRAGKTEVTGTDAIDDPYNVGGLLQGKKVLLLSASQDQADIYWKRITSWLQPIMSYCYKNDTKRLIEFGTGAIKVKTASDADALKGFDADKITLDECAILSASVWFEAVAPMLADRDGTATFISTPKRKNWFYLLFEKAKADTTGRWAWWNFPSMANPYLSKVALDELASDMTADMYRQEILAEFLESGGEVFRKIKERATAQRQNAYTGDFIFGIDTAQKHDYTVISVIDRAKRTLVDMDRFNQMEWAVYHGRIIALYEKWRPRKIVFETNGAGQQFETLQREGLPVEEFQTTSISKAQIIESLALAFERDEITILDDGILTGELSAYERKVSAVTGRSSYSAPEGLHDDCVMALALAWYGVMLPPTTVPTSPIGIIKRNTETPTTPLSGIIGRRR